MSEFTELSFVDVSKKFTDYCNSSWCKNEDAMFKYYNIINYLKLIDFKPKNIIDPGCQTCPLSSFICKKYEIENSYLFDFDKVSGKNIKNCQKKLFDENTNTNLHFFEGDFFENIDKIQENEIDLIIDGCSITHFCGNDKVYNSGKNSWTKMKTVCDKKLSKNGYFIISSDIKHDEDLTKIGSTGEFIYAQDILNIFSKDYTIEFNPIISKEKIDNVLPYPLKIMSLCLKKNLKNDRLVKT